VVEEGGEARAAARVPVPQARLLTPRRRRRPCLTRYWHPLTRGHCCWSVDAAPATPDGYVFARGSVPFTAPAATRVNIGGHAFTGSEPWLCSAKGMGCQS
jgi:hypothetical protein